MKCGGYGEEEGRLEGREGRGEGPISENQSPTKLFSAYAFAEL